MVGLTAFYIVPSGMLTRGALSTLTTFVGLFAAGILPTLTLLAGTMSSSGRSVLRTRDLYCELRRLMIQTFLLFATCLIFVLALTILQIVSPNWLIKHMSPNILERLGVAATFVSGFAVGYSAYVVPKSYLKVLSIKRDIAVDEARRRTEENASKLAPASETFPTAEGFGQSVSIELKTQ